MARLKQPRVSPLEELLAVQLKAAGIEFEREVRFAPDRKFRFDFVVGDHYGTQGWIGVECDGGSWVKGRHARGSGIEKDNEKMNLAVELGWRVLRYTMAQIRDGSALAQIERCLK